MTNATPRDARAGFSLFRRAGGEVTLDDLNARLEAAGYGPVKHRTLQHYRKLIRHGFDRYISINRLDVAAAAERYEGASANSRYSYREVDLGVAVTLAKSSRLLEAHGRAIEVGEVGATIEFRDPFVVEGLRTLKPRPADSLTLTFFDTGATTAGRVIDVDLAEALVTIEVEFGRLTSIAELAYGDPMPMVERKFVVLSIDDTLSLDVIGQRLYHFMELVEGARGITNLAASRQDIAAYASPPTLKSLTVASPATFVIEIAELPAQIIGVGALASLFKVLGSAIEKRKAWHEGSLAGAQVADTKVATALKEEDLRRKQAETGIREEERRRKQAETDFTVAVLAEVRRYLPATLATEPELRLRVIESLLPPMRSLAETGVTSVLPTEEQGGASDE